MATATGAPIFPAAAGGPAGPPPPSGSYSYTPVTLPFHGGPYIQYPQDPHAMPRPVVSLPMPNPNLNPNSNATPNAAAPGPNSGARLMQLLGNLGPTQLETAVSMAPPTSEFVQPQPLPAMPSAPPARMLSSTSIKGRLLGGGERAVHDVDSRLPGEAQPPQLEVTPITKFTSDPGLVLGRQLAANRTYIVYGLKLGNIRVLSINTSLRSLLRGHTQRVTDMAFFAEDVHCLASASVDGRIYVWRIDEGPDEENKPQITGKIEIAIQIVCDAETYHPRICWHSHKQEILFVGIGNCVLRIDMTKVGRGSDFTVEEPVKCHLDKLIDGIHLVGKHDGDVVDLSISQWMSTRLASGSKDGTVKIWDDRRPVPLSILKPHDGQAVYLVAFLTAPEHPNHINLITAGPLNREIKIWASTNEDGWLLPSDSETWSCTQTLELVSSLEPRAEEAFFNQVTVLPQASLILLANAKKNAVYAVHVEYGPDPASTRLDYIADFTVAMPILGLTGTHENHSDGEQVVEVHCVQTMNCSPPTADTTGFGRDPAISRVYEAPLQAAATKSSRGTSFTDSYPVGASSKAPTVDQSADFVLRPSPPSAPHASKMELAGPAPGTRDIDQSALYHTTNRNMERDALERQDTPMPTRSCFPEVAATQGMLQQVNLINKLEVNHLRKILKKHKKDTKGDKNLFARRVCEGIGLDSLPINTLRILCKEVGIQMSYDKKTDLLSKLKTPMKDSAALIEKERRETRLTSGHGRESNIEGIKEELEKKIQKLEEDNVSLIDRLKVAEALIVEKDAQICEAKQLRKKMNITIL
ncbi:LOW QUALITY PROTEIN: hypothetical protein U9M48_045087, partial [Paspalum notatum var. saurae]